MEDTKLKDWLVAYVGTKFGSQDVTVEMIVDVLAKEFPEFLLLVAEENFLRGYQQATDDREWAKVALRQPDKKKKTK